MTKTTHSFDIEMAQKYGIEASILYGHIAYWCQRNRLNGKNIVEDKAYTYNSLEAFSKLFPYITKRKIQTTLAQLKAEGLIEVRNDLNPDKWDKTNWYHAIDNSCSSDKTNEDDGRYKNNIVDDTQNDPSTNQSVNHDNKVQIKHKSNTKEKSKKEKSKSENSPLPDWLDKEAWSEWVQHRKEIKKPMTPLAIQKLFKILETNKQHQREMIDTSIACSYVGLFAPKPKSHTNPYPNKNQAVHGSLEWERQEMIRRQQEQSEGAFDAKLV